MFTSLRNRRVSMQPLNRLRAEPALQPQDEQRPIDIHCTGMSASIHCAVYDINADEQCAMACGCGGGGGGNRDGATEAPKQAHAP